MDRLTYRLVVRAPDGTEREVAVELAPDATVAELVGAVGLGDGPIVCPAGPLPPSAAVRDTPLRDGWWLGPPCSATARPTVAHAPWPGGPRAVPPRPPRPLPPPVPPRPAAPVPPPRPPDPAGPSWAAVLAPVPLAIVMAWLWSPVLALFGLSGPLIGGAQWWEERRRHRARLAEARAGWRRSTAAARRTATDHRAAVTARERYLHPTLDTVVAWAAPRDGRRWERRPDDEDWLVVRVGEHADERPALVDLRGAVVAVAGPREQVGGLLRAVVVRTAVLHPPGAVAITVLTDTPAAWDWTRWLPHLRAATGGAATVTVVDGDPGPVGRPAGTDGAVLVRVDRPGEAPAETTHLLDLTGPPRLHVPAGGRGRPVRIESLTAARATTTARDLAAWADGPGTGTGASDLGALLGPIDDPAAITERWARPDGGLAVCVGTDAAGAPAVLDLVTDGPHALVAGTTGAGKSVLLATLVVGLAASLPPDRVRFVLLDLKGGAGLDACRRLPHVDTLVTDLEPGAGSRTLTCLDAEIRRRERTLRELGVADVTATPAGRLPRLVVVVDELAVLAAEDPGHLATLADLARRGRSLGLHLVLATQRPAGVLTDQIRANVALRIALRVEDEVDSREVVGVPDAAALPSAPGHAIVRTPGGVRALRVARPGTRPRRRVVVRPLADDGAGDEPSLEPVLDAVVAAARTLPAVDASPAVPAPPSPSPPLPVRGGALVLGLVDRPARQEVAPARWDWRDGPLLAVGRGAERAVLTAGVQALRGGAIDLHVVTTTGALAPLAHAHGTGTVVERGDRELLERLLAHLDERHVRPRLLVVEDVGTLVAELDDLDGIALRERLAGLVLDGHTRGVAVAAASRTPAAVPGRLMSAFDTRWVGPLPDRFEAAALGVTAGALARLGSPGRLVEAATGDVVALGEPSTPVGRLLADLPAGPTPAVRLRRLPHHVALADLPSTGDGQVAIGLTDDLAPAHLPVGHLLVCGPAGSGRSTTLATVVAALRAADPDLEVERYPGDQLLADAAPRVVVADDADRLGDDEGLLALARHAGGGVRMVAAVRVERLRGAAPPWLAELRRTATILALRPDPDLDGPALGVRLPRRGRTSGAGRGELVVAGAATLVQVARVSGQQRDVPVGHRERGGDRTLELAGVEGLDQVGRAVAGGDGTDGRLGAGAHDAQRPGAAEPAVEPPEELVAVEPGERQVEEHEVGAALRGA